LLLLPSLSIRSFLPSLFCARWHPLRSRFPSRHQHVLLSHAPQLCSSARAPQKHDAGDDDGEGASWSSSDLFFSLDSTSPSPRRRLDQPGRRAEGLAPPVPRRDPRGELHGAVPGREGEEEEEEVFLSFYRCLFSFLSLSLSLSLTPSSNNNNKKRLRSPRAATRLRPPPAWATRRR